MLPLLLMPPPPLPLLSLLRSSLLSPLPAPSLL